MFEKILVAVDGSEHSTKALEMAVDVARRYEADLVVLCVYKHHSLLEHSISMVRSSEPDAPDAALRSFASEVAAAAKAQAIELGAPKAVEAFAKRGQPARAIVEFAEQRRCDLIVLGARGSGDAGGFFLGSVSHKVTGLAKTTCMVVK
ncbi:universal stress protein [Pelagibacterium montanilacus]|uniref:universal stress protein n=1 Tax=Pelagibacterium montanilacus TaxID=2185280 RepID=UPI000F8D0B4B|nr:universal stress protein [Pelagibacterium montanilacus]